jgi:hypothetical protein
MEIVESQVHANHRGIDQSIAIMDAVGVDAAVIDIWPPVRRKLPNGVMRFEIRSVKRRWRASHGASPI